MFARLEKWAHILCSGVYLYPHGKFQYILGRMISHKRKKNVYGGKRIKDTDLDTVIPPPSHFSQLLQRLLLLVAFLLLEKYWFCTCRHGSSRRNGNCRKASTATGEKSKGNDIIGSKLMRFTSPNIE